MLTDLISLGLLCPSLFHMFQILRVSYPTFEYNLYSQLQQLMTSLKKLSSLKRKDNEDCQTDLTLTLG